jgi:hypothetical protein
MHLLFKMMQFSRNKRPHGKDMHLSQQKHLKDSACKITSEKTQKICKNRPGHKHQFTTKWLPGEIDGVPRSQRSLRAAFNLGFFSEDEIFLFQPPRGQKHFQSFVFSNCWLGQQTPSILTVLYWSVMWCWLADVWKLAGELSPIVLEPRMWLIFDITRIIRCID